MMKLTLSAALLALFIAAPAYALQEPDRDKEKPAQEEPKKEEPKKQEPDRQQPQEKEKQQQDKTQADKAKQTEKQQQQLEKDRAKQDKPAPEHAQTAQRDSGGNGGRTIKEADFRAHFGHEHTFRVARRDDRRFNYGGYWFVYNDPWPVGWSYSDEV